VIRARSLTLAVAVVLGILSTFGCSMTFEEARLEGVRVRHPSTTVGSPTVPTRTESEEKYCRELDARRATLGGVSKGLAAAAGASGLGSVSERVGAPVSPGVELGLGIAAVVAGAGAVGTWFAADGAATAWARDCTGP
jgi:hypothetical protein